jgi:DNA-binding NarL/FixJ family response regulator
MAKKEIAATMHLSVKTVDNHCTSMMNKLDIHDRVDLARYAIREGLAEP